MASSCVQQCIDLKLLCSDILSTSQLIQIHIEVNHPKVGISVLGVQLGLGKMNPDNFGNTNGI